MTVNEGEDWKDVQIPVQEDAEETEVEFKTPDMAVKESNKEVSETHVIPIPKAGPAVMLLCAQYGIDPDKIKETGPKGLIKSDILKYIVEHNLTPLKITTSKPVEKAVVQPKIQETVQPSPSLERPRFGYTDIPLTSMRTVIAKRLSQSKSTSPHGYSTAGIFSFYIQLV